MNATITVNADQTSGTISRHIYGHFAEHLGRCIYEGIWVGEDSPIPNTRGIRNDVLEALQNLRIPVLRWPGGCFADEYHWKDGIGPREQRKRMVNTHWGGVVENNHFGTHEFFDLCELLGTEPYICGNVGSGSVQEMQEWVEYMTFEGESPMADWRRANGREKPWKLKYFGVGNENWGCGGNMRAEYYADEYRRYQTYVRNYGGNRIYKIAGGANVDDYHWTEVLMREAKGHMDGLSLHNYTVPGGFAVKRPAIGFDEAEWFETMRLTRRMDELITRHSAIMDRHDPKKEIGLIVDEWGTWYQVEQGTNPGFLYQQNSLRDALVAALHFHIFHRSCDRVHMANIAQTVNVLQAMILTEGSKMVLTPTYHVFEMFKVHQDAEALSLHLESNEYRIGEEGIPQVSASASKRADGTIDVSLCNVDPNREAFASLRIRGLEGAPSISGRVLTHADMDAHNTFEQPEALKPRNFEGFAANAGELSATLPPKSVVVLTLSF